MDLIDVARIAARRWYVILVVLLAGGAVAVMLASSVAPAYRVEAQSILISGRVAASESGDEVTGNPYLAFSGSLFTTLSAVTRTVDGREYRELLEADGTEQDFTFSTSQEAPVIITESTATTPEGASELSEQVQAALSQTLVTLQSEEGVPQEQQIFMRVLTTSNPEQEVGDRNRVFLGVLGLTLVSAIGSAVLFESVVQARRRARDDVSSDVADVPVSPDAKDPDTSGGDDPPSSREPKLPPFTDGAASDFPRSVDA